MRRYGKGWYGESHRHYLAAKGISTKHNFKYFMALEPRMSVDEREAYIRLNIKKTPESEKEQKVAELIQLTEGLGKQGIDDVLESHEMEYESVEDSLRRELGREPTESEIKARSIDQDIWATVGGSDTRTAAKHATFDRTLAESIEKAALGTVPTAENKVVLRALIDAPQNVEFFDGPSVSESLQGPLIFKKVQSYPERGEEIWHIEDQGENAVLVSFYPRKNKIETNSPDSPMKYAATKQNPVVIELWRKGKTPEEIALRTGMLRNDVERILESSKEFYAAKVTFNPLNPQPRPAEFKTWSLPKKERYIREEEKAVAEAERVFGTIQSHPQFKYNELSGNPDVAYEQLREWTATEQEENI